MRTAQLPAVQPGWLQTLSAEGQDWVAQRTVWGPGRGRGDGGHGPRLDALPLCSSCRASVFLPMNPDTSVSFRSLPGVGQWFQVIRGSLSPDCRTKVHAPGDHTANEPPPLLVLRATAPPLALRV